MDVGELYRQAKEDLDDDPTVTTERGLRAYWQLVSRFNRTTDPKQKARIAREILNLPVVKLSVHRKWLWTKKAEKWSAIARGELPSDYRGFYYREDFIDPDGNWICRADRPFNRESTIHAQHTWVHPDAIPIDDTRSACPYCGEIITEGGDPLCPKQM